MKAKIKKVNFNRESPKETPVISKPLEAEKELKSKDLAKLDAALEQEYEHEESLEESAFEEQLDAQAKPSRHDTMRRGIYILPNLLTSASMGCGFYAIIQAMSGGWDNAAIALIAAAFFDGIDGKVAYLTGTNSRFGVEYDSLADLVSFGVAPGVLVYLWALSPYKKVGWLAAFLYVICGALRLARFNVQVNTVERRYFNGLPIPAAAMVIATTILMRNTLWQTDDAKKTIVLIMTYVLAYLMVSTVKYISFKDFDLIKRKPFYTLVLLVILLTVVVAEPEPMLFLLIATYLASGPMLMIRRAFKKKDASV